MQYLGDFEISQSISKIDKRRNEQNHGIRGNRRRIGKNCLLVDDVVMMGEGTWENFKETE